MVASGTQHEAILCRILLITLVLTNSCGTCSFTHDLTYQHQGLLRLRGGSRVPIVPSSTDDGPKLQVWDVFKSPAVDAEEGTGVLSCIGAVSAFFCCATQQRRQRILNERLWNAAKQGNSERCQMLIKKKGAEIESESIDGGADPANYFYDLYGFTFYEENENRGAGGERAPSQKPPKRKAAARTALRWAAYKGEAHTVSTLLALGADVNSMDPDGWTALHEASLYGHAGVVRALLARDANVNQRTHSSWTPLHLAAAYGHLEIVKLLHEDGADIVKVTDGGLTAMDWAKAYGMADVSDFLRTCSGRRHGACETCGRSNFFVQGGIATKISNF